MNLSVKQIKNCRICNSSFLENTLDIGIQTLTGVFPKTKDQKITSGPLRLVRCVDPDGCGLLQLEHTFSLPEMYGDNYGYRSGLNASMYNHLKNKVSKILDFYKPEDLSVILDIGSNDGTTLSFYPDSFIKIGIDPTASKFKQYYNKNDIVVPDFFSEKSFRLATNKQAEIVTSFSMFYDLEDPLSFMNEIYNILSDNGIWVFEQSYMPTMLKNNSYDTVCHEHIMYYSMRQIKWMMDRVGFKAVDIEFNNVNGGSFSVIAAKKSSSVPETIKVREVIYNEYSKGLDKPTIYKEFNNRIINSKCKLLEFLNETKRSGKIVGGLGASTKGNVLLQYCGLSEKDIFAIGEVNDDKFGSFTPGTLIPIIKEEELMKNNPDYLVVLPWHFRDTFVRKHTGKSKLVFPLPDLEIV
jgi:hypothetical protein